MTTREVIERYLRALERHDLDAVATSLHDDVEIIEHPNPMNPDGMRYDKAAIRAAGEHGKAMLAHERYEVQRWIIDGDEAAVQIEWSAKLRTGQAIRAFICSCIVVKDGQIWRQQQYECIAA